MSARSILTMILSGCLGFSLLIGVAFASTTITRYAILVSGTLDPLIECTQYDTQYMYHVLGVEHYNILEDNIYYLHANTSYPYQGVDAEATKANVRYAINTWLKSRSTANDMVFIYFASHGGGYLEAGSVVTSFARIDGSQEDPLDEGAELPNGTGVDEGIEIKGETYYDDELKADLTNLSYYRLVVMVGTCYGGGFIDDLSGPARIIVTPAAETRISWADGDDDGFTDWDSTLMNALHLGADTKWENGKVVHTMEVIGKPDADDNGYVSMLEAWEYAYRHDPSKYYDSPWLDDNGDGIPTYYDELGNRIGNDGELAKKTGLNWLRGDVNGDKIVDVYDLIKVAIAFGSKPGDPNWNPRADLAAEYGLIDIFDLIVVAINFGMRMSSSSSSSSSGSSDSGALSAETTMLSISPSQITTYRHQTFSLNVTLSNAVNLYGWEFKVYWNSAVLNLTDAQIYAPTIWSQNVFEAGAGIQNDFNSTHGRYWKALSALNPAPSFNGSTVIATLTFKAKAAGTTTLHLQNTKLGDNKANAIAHTTADGSVTVLPQTRYMRGDTQTVNNLTAYKLETAQSSTQKYYSEVQQVYGLSAYWGIRVWKRSANGNEIEITSGVVAQVSRTAQGYGLQSSTWSCPQTVLNSADSIVVRVYQKIGNNPWQLAATFTTEQLGATQLDNATWTIYYYTKLSWRPSPPWEIPTTTASFYWGTQTYNSRTQNFEYT